MSASKRKLAKTIPSSAQAKFIASAWAKGGRQTVMKEAPEGREIYIDPTINACIKYGWLKPSGSIPFYEHSYLWESHAISPEGLLALERYLQKIRFDAMQAHGTLPAHG